MFPVGGASFVFNSGMKSSNFLPMLKFHSSLLWHLLPQAPSHPEIYISNALWSKENWVAAILMCDPPFLHALRQVPYL